MTTALAKCAESKILILRGQKIILDADLAELNGVSVKRLNQQVNRNAKRFPHDFLFRLTAAEFKNLRLQIATSSLSHGGRRYLPHIMAATVLNSSRAIEMSVFIVRAFARMREALAKNYSIVFKLAELERRVENHDVDIEDLMEAVREMMTPPPRTGRRIGFQLPPTSAKALRRVS